MGSDLIVKKSKSKKKKNDDFRGYQLVYQGNRLIEAKYDLTLQEKRLVLFAISKIKIENFQVDPVVFSCRELSDLCGLDSHSFYSDLKKTTAKLMSRVFVIRNLDKQTYTQLNWVTQSTYHEKEGIVEIKFNNGLAEFLLDLKANFTAIPLAQTLGLSSLYAIRMYELLKQYETIGSRTFELETLRETLGIKKDKIKKYNDFKKDVIEISQRELSLKTDICFDFEEIKRSRRVTSLNFLIHKNDPNKLKIEHQKADKIKKEMRHISETKDLTDLGFSIPTIRKFFVSHSHERINIAIQVVMDQIEKGQAKNPKALFQKALKEGWSLDKFVVRNSKE
jgi:plasmid replication initiation protein